ncbi:MAG: hypothetical protein QNJ51_10585 [Calothrix sp. MO_167.B12]|nr:hypothetical protein [Calothrix sp. MO_167.B12]
MHISIAYYDLKKRFHAARALRDDFLFSLYKKIPSLRTLRLCGSLLHPSIVQRQQWLQANEYPHLLTQKNNLY